MPEEVSKYAAVNVKLFTLHWRDSVWYSCCQVASVRLCDGKWVNSTRVETLGDNVILGL